MMNARYFRTHSRFAAMALGIVTAGGIVLASQAALAAPRQTAPERDRSTAVRACSGDEMKLPDYTWGVQEVDKYRVCMTRHGQPE